ncbi:MAG TPA: TIGR03118 family protein, partial [Albitalea sp.]|nr:TIGR03118 family protein [Albitalea sp.]
MNIRAWSAAGVSACALVACGGGDDNCGSSYSMSCPAPTGMAYAATALVSDGTGTPYTDANLVNGWGVAFNPQGYVWVADAGTSKSTLYDGNGVPQSLVVSIPDGTAGEAEPTGIAFNGSTGFVVTQGAASAPAVFLFVGEAGTVSGWAPSVNATAAVTMFDGGAAGSIYKGATLATQGTANFLYATDFHNAAVHVFDTSFAKVTPAGAFTDPALPAGYAPFGIQAIGGNIYVSYAKQDAGAVDDVAGAGLGAVSVFDSAGNLVKTLIAPGGVLNAPWGMALAPANFGPFSNALLVGNFGDGKIHAFNPSTGALLGTVSKSDGSPIVID